MIVSPLVELFMSRKKISTTIYITHEQNEMLKELNRRTNVPVAVYIREGIDLILEKHKDVLPGQITIDVDSGKE
jgi:predicted DNA-binding protein